MSLAFSSKHPFVPNPAKDSKVTRWIASLSDGTTVFQDNTPGELSSWLRLRSYVQLHDLKMTNLRLEAYGYSVVLVPYKDAEGTPQINGYWHSKNASIFVSVDSTTMFQGLECGIGYIKGRDIIITWINENGVIRQENRPYKDNDLATIVNDNP